jgi:hypothetical protein
MASNSPVGVFCAGNYKDTFPFAKCFLYPSFLTLEEKEIQIELINSQTITKVHFLKELTCH